MFHKAPSLYPSAASTASVKSREQADLPPPFPAYAEGRPPYHDYRQACVKNLPLPVRERKICVNPDRCHKPGFLQPRVASPAVYASADLPHPPKTIRRQQSPCPAPFPAKHHQTRPPSFQAVAKFCRHVRFSLSAHAFGAPEGTGIALWKRPSDTAARRCPALRSQGQKRRGDSCCVRKELPGVRLTRIFPLPYSSTTGDRPYTASTVPPQSVFPD